MINTMQNQSRTSFSGTSQRQTIAVAFNRTSSNAKTGLIPVTTTGQQSCPEVCPLKGSGCYAETGPISWHWKKVTNGIKGGSYEAMLDEVSRLPKGQLWRHNAAGDLLHIDETIDGAALIDLVLANKKSKARGFTYTHHDMQNQFNRAHVQYANSGGFTVNLSANSIEHADELKALNIAPVVTIIPLDCDKVTQTPAGNTIVQCPATYSEITCVQCGICQVAARKAIIGFPVHGVRKAAAHKVFMMRDATSKPNQMKREG